MNERQRKILEIVVDEYIKSAEPVSSGYLAQVYDLGVSSATIRNDLAALLGQGYLKKIYFSSGNVPTNRAYRFFVDVILEPDPGFTKHVRVEQRMPRFGSLEEIARFLSDRAKIFSLVMNEDMDLAVDGINHLFAQPDFSSMETMQALARFLDSVMDMRHELFRTFADEDETIFIGEEHPLFSSERDLAWLVGSCHNFKNKRLAMFMVGPTRMPYERNAALLHNLRRCLSK